MSKEKEAVSLPALSVVNNPPTPEHLAGFLKGQQHRPDWNSLIDADRPTLKERLFGRSGSSLVELSLLFKRTGENSWRLSELKEQKSHDLDDVYFDSLKAWALEGVAYFPGLTNRRIRQACSYLVLRREDKGDARWSTGLWHRDEWPHWTLLDMPDNEEKTRVVDYEKAPNLVTAYFGGRENVGDIELADQLDLPVEELGSITCQTRAGQSLGLRTRALHSPPALDPSDKHERYIAVARFQFADGRGRLIVS